MESKDFLAWLDKEGLLRIAKNDSIYFRKVLTDCLAVQNEGVLIVTDSGYPGKRIAPLMAVAYYYAAQQLGYKAKLVAQAAKLQGETSSTEIVSALKELKPGSVMIACLSQSMGNLKQLGKSYRRFAQLQGHRFASTPGLGSLDTRYFSYFVKSIDIDYSKLQAKAKQLKSILDWGKEVRVTTKKGTDISFTIRGRGAIANDGDYAKKSTGGNLPAGEVYIAPEKSSAEGKVIIDGTIKHHWGTTVVKTPVEMIIERGQVIKIEGGFEASLLHKTLKWARLKAKFPWGIRQVSELGIGINPKAALLGSTIIDEKVLGTAHIALGSNYWFGGDIYAILHLDQVFKEPKITVDKKVLQV